MSTVVQEVIAIERAAELLLAAKNTERCATEARIRAETELLALVVTKPEGASTVRTPAFKVTTTGVVNRTIDAAALDAIKGSIAPALFDQAVRYKPDLIAAGVKYLQANEPEAYGLLAQALTAKPGKTSVVVERVERQAEAA